jgi:hypothetical protein
MDTQRDEEDGKDQMEGPVVRAPDVDEEKLLGELESIRVRANIVILQCLSEHSVSQSSPPLRLHP